MNKNTKKAQEDNKKAQKKEYNMENFLENNINKNDLIDGIELEERDECSEEGIHIDINIKF